MDLRAALSPESDYNSEIVDPLVTEAPVGEPLGRLPSHMRDRIMVDVIHDGATIPAAFLVDGDGRPIAPEEFRRDYELDRDWGAGLVAGRLAGALGLNCWYNVRIARVLMDFGRLPGTTHGQADYQSRFAINYPFSALLSYEQRRAVLEGCYDAVSAELERHIRRRVVKIAVHTYDRLNASGTLRPAVSLVTRSQAYQTASRLPTGLYDPLYPDLLAEFTADRVLTDRISLDLEKGGIPVAHNYPYLLPEGSVEVRSQVWFFFNYLRQRFEDEHPDTREDLAFRMVWDLLLDTNLRSSRGEMLRSYLHLYRHAPPGQEALYRAARIAYDRVRGFLAQDDRRVVEDYRFWEDRPSSIGVEIRKDLVWEFDASDRPIGPKPAAAHRIAEAIARAVLVYLNVDHPERAARDGFAPRQDVWPQVVAAQG